MVVLHSEILRQLYRPLQPLAVCESPQLPILEGMRAVLFDVYGTLFISGSGELEISRQSGGSCAMAAAMEAVGLHLTGSPDTAVERLLSQVESAQIEARKRDIPYPEVDIVEVWQKTLAELMARGMLNGQRAIPVQVVQRLAVEYEARVNPVWPMPGVTECLRHLCSLRLELGIISNAQFYTRELFPALLGQWAEAWGFDPALQFYSYQHGVAKPGVELYEKARNTLVARGIEPAEVLYVGNDMLNDIWPAAQVGFRTALFAGDARSLRRREDDPRISGAVPDLVLTGLTELKMCFPR